LSYNTSLSLGGAYTGNLPVAALVAGTANQVLINNGTPTPTWTTLSGDVTNTLGVTTVGQLQGTIVLSGTPASGNVLTATSSTAAHWAAPSGGVTWGSDLVNSTSTNQYVSALSYSSSSAGGAIAINGTGTTFVIATGNTGFSLTQTSTSSGNGSVLTIQAQGATGASHNGGSLVLSSGTSGSATVGNVTIQSGGTTAIQVTATQVVHSTGFGRNEANVSAVKTANYTVLTTDYIVLVDSTSGTFTVTLPASPTVGNMYIIKDSTGHCFTNPVSLSANTAQTIDGAGSYSINNNYESVQVLALTTSTYAIL